MSCMHYAEYTKYRSFADCLRNYDEIFSTYISCTTLGSQGKRKELQCSRKDCDLSRTLHVCIKCMYVGCKQKGHFFRNEIDHQSCFHLFSVDLDKEKLFCHFCDEIIFDEDFEKLEKFNRCLRAKPDSPIPIEDDFFYSSDSNSQSNDETDSVDSDNPKSLFTGLRGILNFQKATCYLSVIAQVLLHTNVIREFYMTRCHECPHDPEPTSDQPPCCFGCEMRFLYEEFFSGETDPLVLQRMISLLMQKSPHFRVSEQGCALEIFEVLLQLLHEAEGGIGDPHLCTCIIHQVFGSAFKKVTGCACDSELISEIKSQCYLRVSFKEDRCFDLKTCLKQTIARMYQTESGHCSFCDQELTHNCFLKEVPFVFCFVFDRTGDFEDLSKINKVIEIPEELNVEEFRQNPDSYRGGAQTQHCPGDLNVTERHNENVFKLYAVVKHIGKEAGKGHYICYIKLMQDQNWYEIDDDKIKRVDFDESIMRCEAFLLFYQHKSFEKKRVPLMKLSM